MLLLILLLILAVGSCTAAYWQKLTCPYELRLKSLQRVWCRQSSAECCSGVVFGANALTVDGGKLQVAEGPGSFTVAVRDLSHGEGLYWCGVLGQNGTFIKLADSYFYSSAASGIYWRARWILLPLMIVMIISINLYIWKTAKQKRKVEEPLYENTGPLSWKNEWK